jgi:hypothetical protein
MGFGGRGPVIGGVKADPIGLPGGLETFGFTKGVSPEERFIYGKQSVPDISDIALGAIGVKSSKEIRNEIDLHNRMVEERAKTLTYLKSMGAKIPMRLEAAGVGGKAAKATASAILRRVPRVPPGFALPEVLTFVPTQAARTRFSDLERKVSDWTPEQRFLFTHPNRSGVSEYANYLNQGGEPISLLQRTLQMGFQHPQIVRGIIEEESKGEEQKEEKKEEPPEEKEPVAEEPAVTPPEEKKTQIEPPELKLPRAPGTGVIQLPEVGLPGDLSRTEFSNLFRTTTRKGDLGLARALPADVARSIREGEYKDFLREYVQGGGDINNKEEIRRRWRIRFDEKFDRDGKPKVEPETKKPEDKQPEPETKKPDVRPPDEPFEDVLKPGEKTQTGLPGGRVVERPIRPGGVVPSKPSPETDPDPSKTTEEKKREPKEEEDDKEPEPKKKKKREPPFPDEPDEPDEPDKSGASALPPGDMKKKMMKQGTWRPLAKTGGQDILLLTEKEKLQEIEDWDVFDLPIDPNDDPSNPLYNHELNQLNFRYFGPGNRWRPKNFYKPTPRKFAINSAIAKAQEPLFNPQHMETPFQDPFERRYYDVPAPRDRTAQSEINDIRFRSSLIYPDIRRGLPDDSFGVPKAVNSFDPVSLSLAMK